MLKSLHQLDRRRFWMWVIPIITGHVVLSIVLMSGVRGPWGPFDTVLIIVLAGALAGRFRDIGWPVWIGPTFLIITMLVVPLAAVGYAFASHPASGELMQWLMRIGRVAGPANLVLLIVSGCVPGKPTTVEPTPVEST